MDTQDEFYKKFKSYDKKILEFGSDENNFEPANHPPKEDGMYITLRCGLTGIYQTLDMYKDGHWQLRVLDASGVIAYSKNKIEL